MINENLIKEELERLHDNSDDGLLTAEQVVIAAQDSNNPLHSQFDWNDTEAGHKYRLWQARQLMVRYRVIYTGGKSISVPVRVSLLSDRIKEGGGYRRIEDVLKRADLKQELLQTALHELRNFQRRYSIFNELIVGVNETIEKLEREIESFPEYSEEEEVRLGA